jgi:hypothetical protein
MSKKNRFEIFKVTNNVNFSVIFGFFLLLSIFLAVNVSAKENINDEKFSFLATGDTRPEDYLPYDKQNPDELKTIISKTLGGEKINLIYDNSGCLMKVDILKGESKLELLYCKDYWPQYMFSYKGNSKPIETYTAKGRQWVLESLVKQLNSGEYAFLVHTGDFVRSGLQGNSFQDSPYWQLLNKQLLSHIQPGIVLAVPGNHEYYQDPNLIGFRGAFPWLKKEGFTEKNRIYAKIYKNSLFVGLDSGPLLGPTNWYSKYPDFDGQMKFLKEQLKAAQKGKKIKNVFVSYHYPSFGVCGHDPLPMDTNPHNLLKNYSRIFNITVFNGHSHTTEHFYVDGINYLVLGGGGAPKYYTDAEHPSKEPELFWKGKKRKMMYNYLAKLFPFFSRGD